MPTILLTGIPRSGTTLACKLLNEFPDTVALAEPLSLQKRGDMAGAAEEIADFIAQARHDALTTNTAVSRHINGVVPENWAEAPGQDQKLRQAQTSLSAIDLNKPLTDDFHLIIKQPGEFTALYDVLKTKYPVFALVRHPLAALAAWQTVNMPIHEGRMPVLEAFHPELTAHLTAIEDRVKRQVHLLGWILDVYTRFPAENIIRYEDMLADSQRSLGKITAHSQPSAKPLKAFDLQERYPGVDLPLLAHELQVIAEKAAPFYPDFNASLSRYM